MKQFRSKSLGVQRKSVELSLTRTKKVLAEMRELSLRDWKGGEMQIASDVRSSVRELEEAVNALGNTQRILRELEKQAAAKGK